MKVTNLTIWVHDNKLSEKFYQKLGFELEVSEDTHSIVKTGSFKIDMVSMRDEEEFAKDSMSSDRGIGSYLYVQVDNVDEKHQELLKKDLKPSSKPRNWPWGNREFVIKDPDGYKICFWQPA